jgi:hypothetical protein
VTVPLLDKSLLVVWTSRVVEAGTGICTDKGQVAVAAMAMAMDQRSRDEAAMGSRHNTHTSGKKLDGVGMEIHGSCLATSSLREKRDDILATKILCCSRGT